MTASSYRPPRWLPGGHAQTIYAFLLPRTPVHYRRERVTTPDGDFIDFDWLDVDAAAPTWVLFHGLEGSSRSHYALACAHAAKQRGWNYVVPHFRGCSGEPNATPRAYHSGDAESIEWMLRHISKKISDKSAANCAAGTSEQSATTSRHESLFACGVSLGGNALTKFCGTQPTAARALLAAAASVCSPLNLGVSSARISQGFNKVYSEHFLRSLRRAVHEKAQRFPHTFDAARATRARSLYEFDDAYTGPMHGYTSGEDYYDRASSLADLKHITIPFLLINAVNDPFVPHQLHPQRNDVGASVTVELPQSGGHVGFVSGKFPGNLNWLPHRLLNFFDEYHNTIRA